MARATDGTGKRLVGPFESIRPLLQRDDSQDQFAAKKEGYSHEDSQPILPSVSLLCNEKK